MVSTILKCVFFTFSFTVYSQDITPNNITTALLGSEITLHCATGAAPFDWWYQHSSADAVQQVCMNGVVVVNYRDRFFVKTSKPDDLQIRTVKNDDAGLYTCVEKGGLGPARYVVQLIVKEKTDASSVKSAGHAADDQASYTTDATTAGVVGEGHSSGAIAAIVICVIILVIILALGAAVAYYVMKQRREKKEVSVRNMIADLNAFLGLRREQPTETTRDEEQSLNGTRGVKTETEQRHTHFFANLKVKFGLGHPADKNPHVGEVQTGGDLEKGVLTDQNVAIVVPVRQKKTKPTKVQAEQEKTKAPQWKNVAQVRRRFAPKSTVEPNINVFLVPRDIELVLTRCLVSLAVKLLNKTPRADIKAVTTLSSVCQMWRIFITNQQRNRRILQRYMKNVSSPYRYTVSRPASCLNMSSRVVGVAHLNNRIYVACESSEVIHLFDATPPYSVMSAPIIKLTTNYISGIVAWEAKNAVFVGDLKDNRLLRIKESGQCNSWLWRSPNVAKHTTPCSLSAYGNCLMILTKNKVLKIYDPKKNELYRVQLSDNVDPFHAVFVATSGPELSVCVCLTQGDDIIKGEAPSSKHLTVLLTSVKRPFHATFGDKFRGFWSYKDQKAIFVASQNKRMMLNDEYGGLKEPGKLCCIDNSRGDLLVCDGCQVKVFQMRLLAKNPAPKVNSEPPKSTTKSKKSKKSKK